MKKRVMTLVICVTLLFSNLLPVQAFAAEEDDFQIDLMTITSTYILSAACNFEINGGQAVMSSAMSATGTDQVRMVNYLQKYLSGSWTSVTGWSKTQNGTYVSWNNTYSLTSGTYRLKTYFYAYIDGVAVESTSRTSESHTC